MKYGESFLTRPLLYTSDLEWVDTSPMQFAPTKTPNVYSLSWLGVINGCPFLRHLWRLACTIDDDTNEILGWTIIRASRCRV